VTKHHHDGLTPFQAAALAVTADASRRAARATEEQNELLPSRAPGSPRALACWLSDEEYKAYIEQQERQAEQQSQRATTISFVLPSPRRAEHLQPGDLATPLAMAQGHPRIVSPSVPRCRVDDQVRPLGGGPGRAPAVLRGVQGRS
jgi:hypothetical protein